MRFLIKIIYIDSTAVDRMEHPDRFSATFTIQLKCGTADEAWEFIVIYALCVRKSALGQSECFPRLFSKEAGGYLRDVVRTEDNWE